MSQLVQSKPQDLRIIVQSDAVREQLSAALPKYYSADQFAVVVRTQINRNPKLGECDPTSLIASMLQAAQMGIVPNGRDGHLIPRWNKKANDGRGAMECTFQPDYKGLVGLVRKNENVSDVYAEPVFDNDEFRITKGLHRDIVHEVDIRKDRGEFVGVYAVIANKDGSASWDFMSKSEVEAIRARSQSPNFGPWVTDYVEMAKKTVLKRLLKLADISQEVSDRIAADPDTSGTPTNIEIKPAAVQTQQALPQSQHAALPPAQQEMEVVESEPTPEPAQKPKAEPVLKKKSAATAPKPEAKSNIDTIREKLAELGKTEEQLIASLVEWDVAKPGEALADMPAAKLEIVVKNWGEIAEEFSK